MILYTIIPYWTFNYLINYALNLIDAYGCSMQNCLYVTKMKFEQFTKKGCELKIDVYY